MCYVSSYAAWSPGYTLFLTTLTLHNSCTAQTNTTTSHAFHLWSVVWPTFDMIWRIRGELIDEGKLWRGCRAWCVGESLQCHHSHSPDQQQFRPRGHVNLVDATLSSSTLTSASPCRCSTSSGLTASMIASTRPEQNSPPCRIPRGLWDQWISEDSRGKEEKERPQEGRPTQYIVLWIFISS